MSEKFKLVDSEMWHQIDSIHPGGFAGIYRLHALDEGDNFLPLRRLLGYDDQSTFYIGTSKRVADRCAEVKKSVSAAYRQLDPKTYGHLTYRDVAPHQTGKKIAGMPRFIAIFPFERLCLTVKRYEGNSEALDRRDDGPTELETRLLREYAEKYAEKPALNA